MLCMMVFPSIPMFKVQNLERFKDDIYKYDVICTYNGKCFDVPVTESDLGIKLKQVHIDLRYVLKSVGFSGGLKGCERKAGIDREELSGLDGYHMHRFYGRNSEIRT